MLLGACMIRGGWWVGSGPYHITRASSMFEFRFVIFAAVSKRPVLQRQGVKMTSFAKTWRLNDDPGMAGASPSMALRGDLFEIRAIFVKNS